MTSMTPEQAIDLAAQHQSAGRFAQAEAIYRQILLAHPGRSDIFNALGNCLRAAGQYAQAVAAYQQAVAIAPRDVPALINLGSALQIVGRLDESAEAYHQAQAIAPNDPGVRFNIGHLELQRGGDLIEGLRDLEPLRQIRRARNPIIQGRPQWDGGDLNGRRILLYAEQGCGDTIQFVRYIPLVVNRGGEVIVTCQPDLTRLLQQSFPQVRVIPHDDRLKLDIDVHHALLSLPLALNHGAIPSAVPYLSVDPAAKALWQARMPADRLKVGIAWSGSVKFPYNAIRSMPPSVLQPLEQFAGAWFCSLQKGGSGEALPWLTDWTEELSDFADTAALIDALDLVISVDTAIPHLAGALGKPVWTLLHLTPDWRWLLDRDDSPWYPTMKLIRQDRLGDWGAPMRRVLEMLRSIAGP